MVKKKISIEKDSVNIDTITKKNTNTEMIDELCKIDEETKHECNTKEETTDIINDIEEDIMDSQSTRSYEHSSIPISEKNKSDFKLKHLKNPKLQKHMMDSDSTSSDDSEDQIIKAINEKPQKRKARIQNIGQGKILSEKDRIEIEKDDEESITMDKKSQKTAATVDRINMMDSESTSSNNSEDQSIKKFNKGNNKKKKKGLQ